MTNLQYIRHKSARCVNVLFTINNYCLTHYTVSLSIIIVGTYAIQNLSIIKDGRILRITYQLVMPATTQGFTVQLFFIEEEILLERSFNISKECSMTIHTQSCTVKTSLGLPALLNVVQFTLSISSWEESGVTNNLYFQELTLENVTVLSNAPSGNSTHAQKTVLTITGKQSLYSSLVQ